MGYTRISCFITHEGFCDLIQSAYQSLSSQKLDMLRSSLYKSEISLSESNFHRILIHLFQNEYHYQYIFWTFSDIFFIKWSFFPVLFRPFTSTIPPCLTFLFLFRSNDKKTPLAKYKPSQTCGSSLCRLPVFFLYFTSSQKKTHQTMHGRGKRVKSP